MTARLIGLVLALLMMVAGGLWAFEGLGWIGEGPPSDQGSQTVLGPIIAGFGVALAYVSVRRRP